MYKTLSYALSLCLLINTAAPLAAQNVKGMDLLNNNSMIQLPKVNPATVLFKDPTKLTLSEKIYLQSKGIKISPTIFMDKYNKTVADYTHDADLYKLTPKEVMDNMDSYSKKIIKQMEQNPRYKKAVRKEKAINYCGAAISGIAIGLLVVACAPAALAYGGTAAGGWFGASAGAGMLATAVSVKQIVGVVISLELITWFASDLVMSLYSDLTDRFIKYNLITNGSLSQEVLKQAAKGTVEGSVAQTCPVKQDLPVVKYGSRWDSKEAHREALIRLTGLMAINEYLANEKGTEKYDLALIDIISLFTDAQEVQFDEKVFTVQEIKGGEIKTITDTNSVIIGDSRLVERTPELSKALKAIQSM